MTGLPADAGLRLDASTGLRANALFEQHRQSIYRDTDRMFAALMLVQWPLAIVLACVMPAVSSQMRAGAVYDHICLAVFLGGAFTSLPLFLAITRPGAVLTRTAIALAQVLMSALLIHICGGRPEMHFHIFVSLVCLALYRDWRVLASATVVVAAEHLLLGAYAPRSLYLGHAVQWWVWLEHTGWVVICDVFLMLSCVQGVREMQYTAQHEALLEAMGEDMRSDKEMLSKTNSVLEHAVMGIARLDKDARYTRVNSAYAANIGFTPEDMIGMSWEETIHPADRQRMRDAFNRMLAKGKAIAEGQGMRNDGTSFHQQVTLIASYVDDNMVECDCFVADISDQKELEAKISHLAHHDTLTSLPNRALFIDRVDQAIARIHRTDNRIAVLFLDLDNFKVVNDSLGHEDGDRLLIMVAERLQDCVAPADTVARMGGDEFSILLQEIAGETDAIAMAERIVSRLFEPIRLANRDVFVTCSIGIVITGSTPANTQSLLRDADTAMYQTKLNGKAGHTMFDRAMTDRAVDRLELETGLRRALEHREFRVFYQPIVSMITREIVGAEALVRWQHPKLGLVPPAKFIGIAEETGMIEPLGAWVLGEACRQAKAWLDEFGDSRPFVMNVNLSGRQLQSPDLPATVALALKETGLEPHRLKLEITESVMMEDMESILRKLCALKTLGCLLAVDDFGTGYSSLSYLQRLPIDTVKIDRSFVMTIGHSSQPAAIVQTIIQLCRTLNLDVTGEGIENAEQFDQLRILGCHHGQGAYFSYAVAPEPFNALLKIAPPTHMQVEAAQEIERQTNAPLAA